MKKNYFLLVLLLCFFAQISQAQRYSSEVFTDADITVESDVLYAQNASILAQIFQGGPIMKEDLYVDFYYPDASVDTETDRPIVLAVHGGTLLPPYINSCWGDKTDAYMVDHAMKLAKMGYVVAVPNYRLGWNPLTQIPSEFVIGLAHGGVRASQDMHALSRFLRKDVAENGNTWGIDAEKQVLWGMGSGAGTVVLNTGYVHSEADYQSAAFITTDTLGNFVNVYDPELFGDINGLTVAINADGDTTNYINHPGYDNTYALVVAAAPVALDTLLINGDDPDDPPLIMFENPNSPTTVTPIGGPLFLPTAQDQLCCQVYFSQTFSQIAQREGLLDDWIGVEFQDEVANTRLASPAYPNLGPIEGYRSTAANADNEWPWIYWDSDACEAISPNAAANSEMSLPGWSEDLASNVLDTIARFFAPRACISLDLGCDGITSTENILENVNLRISPNPSTGTFLFESPTSQPMEEIMILDMTGALKSYIKVNSYSYQTDNLDLANGIYVAKVRFEEGIASRKVVIQK